MRKLLLSLLFISALLLWPAPSPVAAQTIYVDDDGPADFNNIQAAINDANDHDIIIVFPGTYTGPGNRDIDFLGKAVTVRSTYPNDPNIVAATVIDCNGSPQDQHRAFLFENGEGADSVVAGLTVTGGCAQAGGGIWCVWSSPTITNCTFSCNTATTYESGTGYGGVMYCYEGGPLFSNCAIRGNDAYKGGGIYHWHGSSTLINCLISGNSAAYGGAMYNSTGSPTVINCTFSDNSATHWGGAIYNLYQSSPTIVSCILWGNTAVQAPQIFGDGSVVSFSNVQGGCSGQGNINLNPEFVDAPGGDYRLQPYSPSVDSGTNSPPGGLPPTDIDGNPRLIDGDNDGMAVVDMGAYEALPSPEPVIWVSASEFEFTANEGGANPEDQILCIRNSGGATLSWEIIEDCDWLEVHPNSGSSTGEPNEVALAVDIGGRLWGDYSCELTIQDPCAINSPRTVEVNLFIRGPEIELSALEFEFTAIQGGANPQEQMLTIRNSGGGKLNWTISYDCNWLDVHPNSGSSTGEVNEVILSVDITDVTWGTYNCELAISDPNAMNSPQTVVAALHVFVGALVHVPSQTPTIQDAVDYVLEAGTVIVADGIYQGPGNRDIDFKGKAITVRSENGPENCIIDCQGTDQENHRGFYLHTNEEANSIIDGFTIINGYIRTDDWSGVAGSGIYCNSSSPIIGNCRLNNNIAVGYGGSGAGIACNNSSATISNCTMSGNIASCAGAGIYCYEGGTTISNCAITGNTAADGGGIYYFHYSSQTTSSCTITNCTISGNFAQIDEEAWYGYGGGVGCYRSSPVIINCLITGNRAFDGGGFSCYGNRGGPAFSNCTISDNSAENMGGGIFCNHLGTLTIDNCIVWTNMAAAGDEIALPFYYYPTGYWYTTMTINYSDVKGGVAGIYADNYEWQLNWGPGNIDLDPRFVSPGYWADANDPNMVSEPNDPNAVWVDGDYHLRPASPCVEAANNNSVRPDATDLDADGNTAEPIPWDLDSRNRFADGDCNDSNVVDMGSYEFAWVYIGDFDGECDVDFADWAIFALAWLTEQGDGQYNPDCDISLPVDSYIDWRDLEVLSAYWLAGK